jgi:hypothetical protein
MTRSWIVAVIAFVIALVARPEEAGAPADATSRSAGRRRRADQPTVVVWLPAYVAKAMRSAFLRKKFWRSVAVDYRPSGAAALAVVEMVPLAKLDPSTTYEVVMVKGQDPPKPVGSFATGKVELTGAPAFQGIAKASYYKAVPVCCMCMTDDPYAVIELKDKVADHRMGQIRFAVWMSDAAGKIDYKKPPTTIYRGSDSLYLGHPSTCSSANFLFPKQKALKLGIKIIDLAGNASQASEVTLDTTRPVKPPER